MPGYKFWGHYLHSLDSKNRVAIPAKFRQQIPDGKVVITKFYGALAVYPQSEWDKVEANELGGLDPITSAEGRRIQRKMFGSAFSCEVDRQGRVSLSAFHLKISGIKKEVVFQGMNNFFELWDTERWEAWEAAEDQRDDQEE
ncbi:MAG: division/cell wall cluster transcriptional repressor MraZ [Thermoleophilia bacterium]